MRIPGSLLNLAIRSLAESVDVRTMVSLAQQIINNYDIYKRTGFPQNIPIPNRDAAKQILSDMRDYDLFFHFISLLIDVNNDGIMGRQYPISYLRDILKEIFDLGFIYDKANKMIVEDPNIQKTRNWGALRENHEYIFTFFSLDIVGNTELVRKNRDDIINKTYSDLRKIVEKSINKRNGRIWKWEGDGALIAFYFANRNLLATLCGMEIIHELFMYNHLYCQLDKPLEVRLAIHSGYYQYSHDDNNLKNNETIKQLISIQEKFTPPNTLTITEVVSATLDHFLFSKFQKIDSSRNNTNYFNYELRWEK